ncbi:MAG: hypothetical protein NTV10_03485 [Methanoregula sp.]|nr:hypothetical protein [Methanoregula sp.]
MKKFLICEDKSIAPTEEGAGSKAAGADLQTGQVSARPAPLHFLPLFVPVNRLVSCRYIPFDYCYGSLL